LLVLFLGFGIHPVLAKLPRMHIKEGFFPLSWAIFWCVVTIPFWVIGLIQIRKLIAGVFLLFFMSFFA
jgi:cobalt/nickel transport system permease protein